MIHRKQSGISSLAFLGFIVVLLIAAIVWKQQSSAQKARVAAAKEQQALQQQIAADQSAAQYKLNSEREAELAKQKKKFDEKLAADLKKSNYEKSLASIELLYTKWKDAYNVAGGTGRIALSGPVSTLQLIKRDTEALLVPECLAAAKADLTIGMNKVVDGYLSFMANKSLGEILATVAFAEARPFFDKYERDSKICGL